MSYSELHEREYWFFDDREREVIETWITGHGYEVYQNTVCGDCCGMYAEYYYIPTLGKDLSGEQVQELVEYLKSNSVQFSFEGYALSADPTEERYGVNTVSNLVKE